jgi:hypothetical protein
MHPRLQKHLLAEYVLGGGERKPWFAACVHAKVVLNRVSLRAYGNDKTRPETLELCIQIVYLGLR